MTHNSLSHCPDVTLSREPQHKETAKFIFKFAEKWKILLVTNQIVRWSSCTSLTSARCITHYSNQLQWQDLWFVLFGFIVVDSRAYCEKRRAGERNIDFGTLSFGNYHC